MSDLKRAVANLAHRDRHRESRVGDAAYHLANAALTGSAIELLDEDEACTTLSVAFAELRPGDIIAMSRDYTNPMLQIIGTAAPWRNKAARVSAPIAHPPRWIDH